MVESCEIKSEVKLSREMASHDKVVGQCHQCMRVADAILVMM